MQSVDYNPGILGTSYCIDEDVPHLLLMVCGVIFGKSGGHFTDDILLVLGSKGVVSHRFWSVKMYNSSPWVSCVQNAVKGYYVVHGSNHICFVKVIINLLHVT